MLYKPVIKKWICICWIAVSPQHCRFWRDNNGLEADLLFERSGIRIYGWRQLPIG